jgi:hypothetical protein
MADVVNLRRARKQRNRAEKEQAAQENRVRFGRTKAGKASDTAARERQQRIVDGARLEDETPRRD